MEHSWAISNLNGDVWAAILIGAYLLAGAVSLAYTLYAEYRLNPYQPVVKVRELHKFALMLIIYLVLWPAALIVYLTGAHSEIGNG